MGGIIIITIETDLNNKIVEPRKIALRLDEKPPRPCLFCIRVRIMPLSLHEDPQKHNHTALKDPIRPYLGHVYAWSSSFRRSSLKKNAPFAWMIFNALALPNADIPFVSPAYCIMRTRSRPIILTPKPVLDVLVVPFPCTWRMCGPCNSWTLPHRQWIERFDWSNCTASRVVARHFCRNPTIRGGPRLMRVLLKAMPMRSLVGSTMWTLPSIKLT